MCENIKAAEIEIINPITFILETEKGK